MCTTRWLYEGPRGSVALLVLPDGSSPADDYFQSLSSMDKQKLGVLFERFGHCGAISNKTKFKKLEGSDGIFEFKSFQIRLLCFFAPGSRPAQLIITNGVTKKDGKHDRETIRRAERLKSNFLESN